MQVAVSRIMTAQVEDRLQRLYDKEGRNTSSTDPKMMNARVFIGNLPAEKVSRQEVEKIFAPFGKILGVSLHKSYGFVQFDDEESAREAVKNTNGSVMHGLRLDINIATERRKDPMGHEPRGDHGHHEPRGDRRRLRSPSPPPRFRDRERMEFERFRHWERFGRRSPPPPHFRGDPYRGDPYYGRLMPPPPRDPYGRPRDDPYDRFPPRERYPPPRDFPPYPPRDPRDFPPPHRGDPYDRFSPDPRDMGPPRRRQMPPMDRKDGEKLTDMEIVVVNRQQKDYAELVRSRIESMSLVVETVHLSPTVSLADALDDAAQRGLLYAAIITSQHEMHRSVTLTILHGRNPQEHKNMPLDDALGLIDRDYERYCKNVRDGRIPPRRGPANKEDVSQLLSRAASGESLSQDQLTAVIGALQKKQDPKSPVAQSAGSSGRPSELEHTQPQTSDDIQRQQADLQAKILSLLGSNAVVPSSSQSSQSQSSGYGRDRDRGVISYPQPGGGSSGSYGAGSRGGTADGPSAYDAYGYGNYR